jgi:predicted nucleic acid-binding protein
MDLVADTSLLVGLWRRQSWATSFAHENPEKALGIPWVVLGEFWHGAMRAGHAADRVREFLLLGIPLMDPAPVIPQYAKLCADLQGEAVYHQIGQNDLWIAAVSLAYDRPMVTRNRRHFGAMDGLACVVLNENG